MAALGGGRSRLRCSQATPALACIPDPPSRSAGFHRAKPLHTDWLRVVHSMRASAYIYTTPAEVAAFGAALRECVAARRSGK